MTQMISQNSSSVAETEAIAAELARTLCGGQCIALHGDLGAGKTQFVRGLVRGLGGSPRAVSSPTYVLLHIYDIPRGEIRRVFHLDAYRTHGADDFEAIGFGEFLDQSDGLVVVEWPERVSELLPRDAIHIRITAGESSGERLIELNLPERAALPPEC